MIGHFSADDLASYRAGAVSDGKAARIGAHLSACSHCAGVDSGLADVSQLLASIPVPSMPETLTQRLQAVIADEAAQRTAAGETGWSALRDRSPVPIPGRPELPERARRPVRRRRARVWPSPLLLRGLAAVGALVLLVGGGILLANQRGAGTSSSRVAGAGPASRHTRSRVGAAPVGSAAAIRLHYQHGAQIAYTNVVTSNVDYTKKNLPTDIRQEAANNAVIGNSSPEVAPASVQPEPSRQLSHTTVGQLESCLSAVTAGHLVLLVEVAHYLGRPATIIVFRPVGNVFDVIVVGAACGPANEDIITTLTVPAK